MGTGFFEHRKIVSAVKKEEFVCDWVSYIVLRSRWCKIIALNEHAPSEEKSDDSKDSFYEELEKVFDKRDASRHFRNKKKEAYLKAKIEELETNEIKNIRDLSMSIGDFKMLYNTILTS